MLAALLISSVLSFPSHQGWRDAQEEVARRYPHYRQQVYAMQAPTTVFRAGIFYDGDVGKDVYGSCVLGRDPEVIIGIVADPTTNKDTITHEYKHSITFRLPLSKKALDRATQWIDNSGPENESKPVVAAAGLSRSRAASVSRKNRVKLGRPQKSDQK